MKKIILTRGLPASGKTTWAKKVIENNPGIYKRINKDDLRAMLDGGRWSPANEQFLLQIRDMIILKSLESGKHVIIDDTNLHPKHEKHIRDITKGLGEVEIKDFTHVDLKTCIARDAQRTKPVGEKNIRDMYNQFLTKEVQAPIFNPKLPTCIICDLDGTLCLYDRSTGKHYDRDYENDTINPVVKSILDNRAKGVEIVFCSGRKDNYRKVTQEWLNNHGYGEWKLLMRKHDDLRKDYIIKKEIYESEIKGKYNVFFILDDRNQVVELWRSLGLTCLQVENGNF